MPEPACIMDLRSRLQQHGLPRRRLERIVRETAEHWEDSRAAALEDGLMENAAATKADLTLGDPGALAESFTRQLRRRSWLGRHPVLAIMVLPTLLVLFVFCLFALPISVFDSFADFSKQASLHSPGGLRFVVCSVWILYGLGTAFAPVALSGWAWRSGLGRRFVLLLCAGCALATSGRSGDARETRSDRVRLQAARREPAPYLPPAGMFPANSRFRRYGQGTV